MSIDDKTTTYSHLSKYLKRIEECIDFLRYEHLDLEDEWARELILIELEKKRTFIKHELEAL